MEFSLCYGLNWSVGCEFRGGVVVVAYAQHRSWYTSLGLCCRAPSVLPGGGHLRRVAADRRPACPCQPGIVIMSDVFLLLFSSSLRRMSRRLHSSLCASSSWIPPLRLRRVSTSRHFRLLGRVRIRGGGLVGRAWGS